MGRVIKKGAAGLEETGTGLSEVPASRKILKGEKYQAKSEAKGIRDRAEAEAQHIIEQAHEEAEQLKASAYEEAKQSGYMDGREEASAELVEVIASASRRMQQIESQALPQLKELALKIAKKILGRELEFHPDAVVDIVKQALSEKARQRREIYLRVNPADLNHIREHKRELVEVLSRCKEIGLREDPDVALHGVIIETDAGTIDAQLETQLAVFEKLFKDMG